uniref:Muscle M-line assembly protein unc-89 n=1 Tax=Lygus hesperus TaxID=30085 RepID=A0A0A9ZCD4_LYGHE
MEPDSHLPSLRSRELIPNESGTLITMRCTCTAKPKPSVVWMKGTKVVSESSRTRMKIEEKEDTYILSLEITDPIGPDSGTYKCHVKNEFGESNANLNLNIEAENEPEGTAPTFIEKPKIRSEKAGKLVVMDFKVKADPKPVIVWYHEGQLLKESSRLSFKLEEIDGGYYIRLDLKDPGIQDSGVYKCNIKNECGELNANLTLNIEIVPVIKEAPKTVSITKSSNVVIECKVQSVFQPKVTWMKETTIIKESTTHSIAVQRIREGEYSVKLEISPASAADKGSYKLIAKNAKGETMSNVIDVIVAPPAVEAPVFKQKLISTTTVEGQKTIFTAMLSSIDKTVTIKWTKNGKTITSSSTAEIKFDGSTCSLIIDSTKKEDEGTYTVIATNSSGTSESSASLIVQEKFQQEKKEEKKEVVKKQEEKKEEKKEEKVEQKLEMKRTEEKTEEVVQKKESIVTRRKSSIKKEETLAVTEKKEEKKRSSVKKVAKKESKIEEVKEEVKPEAKPAEEVESEKITEKVTEKVKGIKEKPSSKVDAVETPINRESSPQKVQEERPKQSNNGTSLQVNDGEPNTNHGENVT